MCRATSSSGLPSSRGVRYLYPVLPLTVPAPWITAVPSTATNQSAVVALKVNSFAESDRQTVGLVAPAAYLALTARVPVDATLHLAVSWQKPTPDA